MDVTTAFVVLLQGLGCLLESMNLLLLLLSTISFEMPLVGSVSIYINKAEHNCLTLSTRREPQRETATMRLDMTHEMYVVRVYQT